MKVKSMIMPGWLRGVLVKMLARPVHVKQRQAYAAVILKADRLGDFVLALGAIRSVAEAVGEDGCLLIVSSHALPLARTFFPKAHHLMIPAFLGHGQAAWVAWSLKRRMGSVTAPFAVVLRHIRWDYDEMVISWLGVERCVRMLDGFSRKTNPYMRRYECQKPGGIEPVVVEERGACSDGPLLSSELQNHRQVVAAALGRVVDDKEVIPVLASRRPIGGIVVSPFGSSAIRDVPYDLLLEAIAQAVAVLRDEVVLVGTVSQKKTLCELAGRLPVGGPTVRVECELEVDAYVEVVAAGKLVITAETATAHIAAAANRPTVVFLGGGHHGLFGPWRRSYRQQWLTHRIDCFGCNWSCPFPEPRCLVNIDKEAVGQAVRKALSGEVEGDAQAETGTGGCPDAGSQGRMAE